MIGIRAHFENLALGTAGTFFTIEANRFHLQPEDRPIELATVSSSERAFQVRVRFVRHKDPPNVLDGFTFDIYRVTYLVAYALTHAGGDLAEALAEQDGPGTEDVIADRWSTDVHSLCTVVEWHENQVTSPAGILLETEGSSISQKGQKMVGELSFLVTVKATRGQGSYTP